MVNMRIQMANRGILEHVLDLKHLHLLKKVAQKDQLSIPKIELKFLMLTIHANTKIEYELSHVHNWLSLFMFMHNADILHRQNLHMHGSFYPILTFCILHYNNQNIPTQSSFLIYFPDLTKSFLSLLFQNLVSFQQFIFFFYDYYQL